MLGGIGIITMASLGFVDWKPGQNNTINFVVDGISPTPSSIAIGNNTFPMVLYYDVDEEELKLIMKASQGKLQFLEMFMMMNLNH